MNKSRDDLEFDWSEADVEAQSDSNSTNEQR